MDFDVFMNKQENTVNDLPLFKECAIDYNTHEIIYKDNEVVMLEGDEALKVWIYKCLKTTVKESIIHSKNYGTKLKNHIGTVYNETIKKVLIQEEIKAALLTNPYIVSVVNFNFDYKDDCLFVTFNCNTVYGVIELGKEVEVGY